MSTFQFSPDQVAQFREQGFVAITDFWSESEVRAMQLELERLQAEGLLHNVATDGEGKTVSQTKANLQLCPMSPYSRLFRAMPFAKKVVKAVSQLIGNPVLLHLDQVFLKPARHGSGTNWHQDNAYFKISDPLQAYFKISDPLQGTAIWTAVHNANAANGTMRVIPGSFREEYIHDRDPESDHHIRCWPDESKAVTIELPAGGALFFCYGTAHATGANRTDTDRAGIALHFLNANQQGSARAGFEVETRPALTGPDADGGQKIHCENLAETWPGEVSRVLSKAEID